MLNSLSRLSIVMMVLLLGIAGAWGQIEAGAVDLNTPVPCEWAGSIPVVSAETTLAINANAGTLADNSETGTMSLTRIESGTLTFAGPENFFSGTLNIATGGITLNDGGLNSVNTYSGCTTISTGTLYIDGGIKLPPNNIVTNGGGFSSGSGTLCLVNFTNGTAVTWNNSLTGCTLNLQNSGNVNFIDLTGTSGDAITLNGGTLVANITDYSGFTTIQAGELQINQPTNVISPLYFGNTLTIGGSGLTKTGTGVVTVNLAGNLTNLENTSINVGTLTIDPINAGTLTIDPINAGTLTINPINAGTLTINPINVPTSVIVGGSDFILNTIPIVPSFLDLGAMPPEGVAQNGSGIANVGNDVSPIGVPEPSAFLLLLGAGIGGLLVARLSRKN